MRLMFIDVQELVSTNMTSSSLSIGVTSLSEQNHQAIDKTSVDHDMTSMTPMDNDDVIFVDTR